MAFVRVTFVRVAFACSALTPRDSLKLNCSLVVAGVADARKRHRHCTLALCVEVAWAVVENEAVGSLLVVAVVL